MSTKKILPTQPEVNIGTLGHVDNGKSTIVQAITGIWPARHSEELKRGITIKIGYADAAIYKCPNCEEPFNYTSKETCPRCGSKTEFVRAVSFIDCPGHHSLMVTMLSGAALFDGAIFVADVRHRFPQPQDREHLQAALILGVKKLVFAQNKVDVVTKERAAENYSEIKEYIKGTVVEEAPIIPVSGQHAIGIEALLWAMEKFISTPPRELDKPFRMPILRSFDINPPGTPANKIKGGVIGGSIIKGVVRLGDEIEIAPGVPAGERRYEPLLTEVVNIRAGERNVKEAKSGGLTGIETKLDPALTKSDGMTGNMAGAPGTLPPTRYDITIEYTLFDQIIGLTEKMPVAPVKEKEQLVLNVYSAVTSGIVTRRTSDVIEISLKRPVVASEEDKVAISRIIGSAWRLIGYGKVV
ncbi:MAG: translation initiation factor IF-2 subunit gamma [Nitrososphaeria archaeon]|nr:translation initiation factor IF-2 subunit gamma [Aigarchaeota archaeon]MCX8187219.1 translation initiation factor IF-2 subunit gamma [Nitrososphaeria archaeon]MDW8021700.1 translation initiation factor IF-2 subunit gamma [Nitrososphaerota archaeon]